MNMNPWNDDIEELNPLRIEAKVGDLIYIPPYWLFSMKYGKETTVVSFQYQTYANTLAISPDLVLHFVQLQNIKRRTLKKMKLKKVKVKKKEKSPK